ncbi:DUF1643 domain-containing protein [Rummeliibacillus stabekisii]|uniref:DUF1643 domain-containing protein n=1 Tax=Rummeliibacillus stabekisii TaxID=241244 RepID=UPI00116ADCA3|nr:DUF1643 domain-containing protein [Rummeliibacillus stabekisii]MBB5171569.1 hypothetical protein [Rummeliibacillus stabekisii]GEL05537.1 hypothetical protein RST01_21640 [Rummeliibacillus stabekisii]
MRPWKDSEIVDAVFDETKKHRLHLICEWNADLPLCLFILLNPSTADLEQCDSTLDRCIKIAMNNGFGSIGVVNLFSLRTPSPNDLLTADVRTLPENIDFIKQAIDDAEIIVAGWGEKGSWFNASFPILKYLVDQQLDLFYLDLNKYGLPKHPLYLSADTLIKAYKFH